MCGGISPRHAQNPLSGERRKTLSITHHALSPPPSYHHPYIIHLINWLQRFYRIIMSLERPFVPKSDVKQWFTTTTTTVRISPHPPPSLYLPPFFHILECLGVSKSHVKSRDLRLQRIRISRQRWPPTWIYFAILGHFEQIIHFKK